MKFTPTIATAYALDLYFDGVLSVSAGLGTYCPGYPATSVCVESSSPSVGQCSFDTVPDITAEPSITSVVRRVGIHM